MTLYSTVEQSLLDIGIEYTKVDEQVIKAGFQGTGTHSDVFFTCEEENQVLVVNAVKYNVVSENFRCKAAELLTRVNYNLMMGAYSMDFSDGEFCFRMGIDVEDGVLSTTMVRNMIFLVNKQIDEMYPYLMKLIYGGGEPEELYKEWLAK